VTAHAEAAHTAADLKLREAHPLDCDVWSTRLIELQCHHCNHTDLIDLKEMIWPRDKRFTVSATCFIADAAGGIIARSHAPI
jgi:hypothetical protein